jgi:isoleucyl-tRNA synthetase
LETTCRLAAPLLPLTTEVIWKGLTGERSVHLADWVPESALPADPDLVAAMDEVRKVASTGSSLRKAKKLRVRLPLLKLTVAVPNPERLEPYRALIADELNVKSVELTDDIAGYGKFELTVNARAAGPRLGKEVQTVIRAVKAGDWAQQADGTVVAAGITLQEGEFDSRLVAAEPDSTAALPEGGGLVILDDTVTEELEAEGWARDRIREIQEFRREQGLNVSDRIHVTYWVDTLPGGWDDSLRELIAGEVLATQFELLEDLNIEFLPPLAAAEAIDLIGGSIDYSTDVPVFTLNSGYRIKMEKAPAN